MNNNVPTNCCNCGAVMEYSKQHYGGMYKCLYCGTEHHVDLLGRIEEYKVRLMWQGHLIEAWLDSVEMHYVYDDWISVDGTRTTIMNTPRFTLTFSGRVSEERED